MAKGQNVKKKVHNKTVPGHGRPVYVCILCHDTYCVYFCITFFNFIIIIKKLHSCLNNNVKNIRKQFEQFYEVYINATGVISLRAIKPKQINLVTTFEF